MRIAVRLSIPIRRAAGIAGQAMSARSVGPMFIGVFTVAAALLLLLLGGLSLYGAARSMEASNMVDHSQEVLSALDRATIALLRAEAAQQRYLGGRDPADATERERSVAIADAMLGKIATLVQTYPGSEPRFYAVRTLARQRLADLAETSHDTGPGGSGIIGGTNKRIDKRTNK